MFRRFTLAVLMVAMLVLQSSASAAAADPSRPFKGYTAGTSVIGPATADCPAGSMFLVEDHGTGNLAHLGRVSYTFAQCAAVDFATGEGWLTRNGSMTITAANGDRLLLSYDSTFRATPLPIPTTASAHLDWLVVGGTGLFEGASGSGEAALSVKYTPDLTGAVSYCVWSGTITY